MNASAAARLTRTRPRSALQVHERGTGLPSTYRWRYDTIVPSPMRYLLKCNFVFYRPAKSHLCEAMVRVRGSDRVVRYLGYSHVGLVMAGGGRCAGIRFRRNGRACRLIGRPGERGDAVVGAVDRRGSCSRVRTHNTIKTHRLFHTTIS